MDYRLLGSLEVRTNGTRAHLGTPKERSVLAILLLHAGEVVSSGRLIELLWGDRAPRTAAHSIQLYISALRRSLAPVAEEPVIVTTGPGYSLEADPDTIDVLRFERLVSDGTRKLDAGDRAGGIRELREALNLWRGPPLPEFTYEEFAQEAINRLQRVRLDAMQELAAAELAEGHLKEALALAQQAIGEDPLRERARELEMLALYRSGRHPEALRSYQRFHALLVEELGLDPSPRLQRLQERILLHDPDLESEAPEPETVPREPIRNPYKGLRHFVEEDAHDFFGRDAAVRELIGMLEGGVRLLSLVGPSGCGKSSIAFAGLVAALRGEARPRSGRWAIATMTPGAHPFEELESALKRSTPRSIDVRGGPTHDGLLRLLRSVAGAEERLLVVVDEFEELFSLTDEDVAAGFLHTLAEAVTDPDHHIAVVLTLRGDFYDRPLLHPEFAPLFAAGVVNVMPLTVEGIEAAVRAPAAQMGCEIEPALLADLVADSVNQPEALPLLQYVLTELFELRRGRVLTQEAYRALGGLRGVLSRRSEEIYGGFAEDQRFVANQVFLRLVAVGPGRHQARRAPLADLMALSSDHLRVSEVLESFGAARLLSFDRDAESGAAIVELAHEALLWEWGRLAEWIDRHREDLRRRDSLTFAAGEWESSGRDPGYLLTGRRLADSAAWARETTLRLTRRERQFLKAGLARLRTEEAAHQVDRDRQRRLERSATWRLRALVTAVLLIAAGLSFGVLAWSGGGGADVALVWDGARDGSSSLIEKGFDHAVSHFGMGAEKVEVTDGESVEDTLRQVAEEGTRLIVTSWGALSPEALRNVAIDYPDTSFVTFDHTGDLPNVSYLTFADDEGAFLAGAAAAAKSRTGVIGFIGGMRIELVGKAQAGFGAGARMVDPDVEIRSRFLDTFPDFSALRSPGLAAAAAESLYEEGVDVIFTVAESSGQGVFDVAARRSDREGRHLWAIGMTTDQHQSVMDLEFPGGSPDPRAWPDHILTSMTKRIDEALYAELAGWAEGTLSPTVRTFGLAEDGVDLAYSGGHIDELRPMLERLRARIVTGDIDIP